MSDVSRNSVGDRAEGVVRDTDVVSASADVTSGKPVVVDNGKSGSKAGEYNVAATAASFAAELASQFGNQEEEKGGELGRSGTDLKGVISRFGDNDLGADKVGKTSSSGTRIPGVFPGLEKSKSKAGPSGIAAGEGLYAKVPRGTFNQRRGKVALDADTGLFPFNYVAGRGSEFTFAVSRDDRMSPPEAKARLLSIFTMYGIENEPHDYLYSFTHAMLVAHALNGASVVGPGRAAFTVGQDPYSYGDIVKSLGQDMRRFFRAYADETAKALAEVLQSYDPCDASSVTICGQIRMIAVTKRLIQYPYLIHDSADACVRINVTEAAAVLNSKTYVLDKKPNAIDSVGRSAD